MTQLLVTNCLGTFIIQNKKITDKIFFKEAKDFTNQKLIVQHEVQLVKKHPTAKKEAFFVFPQAKEYLEKFYSTNIAIAKQACKDAVKKEHYVMQAVETIQDIERTLHPLVKRVRQWYSLYCPEVNESIANHEAFIKVIITKKKAELLKEFHLYSSMGAEMSAADLAPLQHLAEQIHGIYVQKQAMEEYIEKALHDIAPNLAAVAGPLLAAELLAKVGSLEKLAKMPASTVQVIGAEDAMFRHLRKQGRCPRHGIIIKHPLLAGAKEELHGKIARKIAAALSLAAKLDYFKGDAYKGYELREKLDSGVATIVNRKRTSK
jgi:nucleolar protein 56